jgi:hypothetical protein
MKSIKVYFKVFNKQFKTTVSADNQQDAYNKVRMKIVDNTVFCKLEEDKDKGLDSVEYLENFFGFSK